jgi:iron transport multicopper oxidase
LENGIPFLFYAILFQRTDGQCRYHTPAPSLEVIIPVADATLINGKGRYSGGPQIPLAVVNVICGKRYRFRLVSISCDPNHIFSIDGHQLTIIEADGKNTKPLTVDSIQIFAGA